METRSERGQIATRGGEREEAESNARRQRLPRKQRRTDHGNVEDERLRGPVRELALQIGGVCDAGAQEEILDCEQR